ncbi:MAG: discoidin domain-containing protein [bacterium]|nr:discoidin domain-containing protein [bacterium]
METDHNKEIEKDIETLKKDFVVVGKTRVRSWHAWLIIGLSVGISVGILFVANRSGEFEAGMAASWGTATARSYISGLAPGNAIDGNLSNFYSSKIQSSANSSQWISIAISPSKIHKVRILPRIVNGKVFAFPVNFSLQYSTNNGSSFTNIPGQTFTNYVADTDWQDFFFEPLPGVTNIRFNATKLGVDDYNNYYLQLSEIILVAPPGNIQGVKVKMPGNQNVTPPGGELVSLDGDSPTSANPYFFNNISAGKHTVSVIVPSGWSVGYTLCTNSVTCHTNIPTLGNSVTVNVPSGGYADLWWHYTPLAPGRVQGFKLMGSDQTKLQNEKVFIDGKEVNSNPYYSESISAGIHTISVSVPQGWTVSYTACINNIDCHDGPKTTGNSATINVPSNGYIDLYWHYMPPESTSSTLSGYNSLTKVLDLPDAWDYGPAIIALEGEYPKVHIFWDRMTTNSQGRNSDNIYHVTYNMESKTLLSAPQKILSPSVSGWDSMQAGDPAVVRGEFKYNNQTYGYALYYTGTDHEWAKSRIGVAFSNNLIDWVKYPNPVLNPKVLSEKVYGAGIPSAYSVDGKSHLYVFYSNHDPSPYFSSMIYQDIYYAETLDGINFSAPKPISYKGLSQGDWMSGKPRFGSTAFAYDYSTGKWFMAMDKIDDTRQCSVQPSQFPHMGPVSTYSISNLDSGTWTKIGSIDSPENNVVIHNPAFLTDQYGNITPFKSNFSTFYSHGWCWDIRSWGLYMGQGNLGQ